MILYKREYEWGNKMGFLIRKRSIYNGVLITKHALGLADESGIRQRSE